MAGTFSSLLYHIVFSTKDRRPTLQKESLGRLHEYLGGTVHGLGGTPLGIGGTEDHVRLFVSMKPTHCLSDFLREVKKASSKWVSEKMEEKGFHWQDGYSVFSVSASAKRSRPEIHCNAGRASSEKIVQGGAYGFPGEVGVQFEERFLD